MTQHRAVLFDLGDVLVRLRFERGFARLAALVGADPEAAGSAARVYLGQRAIDYNAGRIAPEAFLGGLVEGLGGRLDRLEACAEAWCDIFDPWPEMEVLAGEVVDSGCPVWLLSNTDPLHFKHLQPQMPILERFTGLCLSYQLGAVKPDPAFFAAALARIDLDPGACLFIDDRAENVVAAQTAGIPSLLHRGDVDEVRAFLRAGGVEFRADRMLGCDGHCGPSGSAEIAH